MVVGHRCLQLTSGLGTCQEVEEEVLDFGLKWRKNLLRVLVEPDYCACYSHRESLGMLEMTR